MLEKISAVASVQRPAAHSGTDARLPAEGETIRLALEEIADEYVVARTADGLTLRLAGLSRLAAAMAPGDLLSLRVLATEPALTLSLVDTIPAHGPDAGSDGATEPASMRADQLAWRSVRRPAPDAPALAAAWRNQVINGLERTVASGEQAPSAVFIAALQEAGATLRQDSAQARPQVPDYWICPINGWTGSTVLLRLLDPDTDDAPMTRRRRAAVLRIELDLPGLGRIAVRVQLAPGGISLTFEVQQDSTLDFLRDVLPRMAEALGSAGLPVQRCRLGHGLTIVRSASAHVHAWSASVLPPALFRAAAEIALVLSAAASTSTSA